MEGLQRSRLGIVVIGRNEGERLRECLASIRSALGDVARDACVYVDSGSTDGSVETAREFCGRIVCLDPASPFTAARARNEGFAALRASVPDVEFVQFVDGDCVMHPQWWCVGTRFLAAHENVAAVSGRLRERYPERSVYNMLCDIEWRTSVGETAACGGVVMIRAAAFASVGGFRSDLFGGEEPELCVRLREKGWLIWHLGEDMALHDAAITRFSQWWARMVRNGAGFIEVALLHRRSSEAIWQRETLRALLWALAIPAVSLVAAAFHPAALLLLLAYPVQIARIAVRRGLARTDAWQYALFMTLGKFAEVQGMARFAWRRLHRSVAARFEVA